MKRRIIYCLTFVGIASFVAVAGAFGTRHSYESAEYKVIEADSNFEIREYPDLVLASTETVVDAQGKDGSFMRLFQYISGANRKGQKIAMTTPVFMQRDNEGSSESMGFVVPKDVASQGAPAPQSKEVAIRSRQGGRFAAIRFSGRLSSELVSDREAELREWLASRNLKGQSTVEAAGYDPPYIPGRLRRNEVLIRLVDGPEDTKLTGNDHD